MAIDIRANVTCSLGTLISGSISDDYLQGSGLVKTRGSAEISALITPDVGTIVTFSYTKNGVTRTIPRKLRVLSSFADPFRRTTKVELGCKLTYLSDLQEPIDWGAVNDPENADYTDEDKRLIPLRIYASSVMRKCLAKLGIVASSVPLTNGFVIDKFDFSPGYVQVLSDLLVSESYFGYLDFNEILQVKSLNQEAGTGRVFESSDIIDISPINVGQLPGEAVIVSYDALKLSNPDSPDPIEEPEDEEELETLNWESVEVTNLPETYYVNYKLATDPEGIQQTATYTGANSTYSYTDYKTITVIKKSTSELIDQYRGFVLGGTKADIPPQDVAAFDAAYDADPVQALNTYFPSIVPYEYVSIVTDRWARTDTWEPMTIDAGDESNVEKREVVASRFTQEKGPLISIASSVAADYLTYGVPFDDGSSEIILSQTLETFEYDQKGNQIASVQEVKTTQVSVGAGLSVSWADDTSVIAYSTSLMPTQKTVTSNKILEDYTEDVVSTYIHHSQTQEGQQGFAAAVENASDMTEMQEIINTALASGLTHQNTQITISRKGITTAQERPGITIRLRAKYAKAEGNQTQDQQGPQSGPELSRSAQLVLALGSAQAERRIELSLPYAPDDYIIGPSGGPYYQTSGGAQQKAVLFGRIQNRMLLGNRNGMNLQVAPEKLPEAPFDPIYVKASGLTAHYRVNGTQWAFDSNGIVCSTDALFWAAVGGTGTFWFPVAPGVTTLPAEPAIVNGQMTPTTVVKPYNETALYEAVVRTQLQVTKFEYALGLLTVVPALVVTTGVTVVRTIPTVNITLTAHVPTLSGLQVPSGSLALTAHKPYAQNLKLGIPAVALGVSGLRPYVNNLRLAIPLIQHTLAAQTPTITTTVKVDAITYTQSSVWSGSTAASNAIMTDQSFNNTGAATDIGNPAWIKMDLGGSTSIATVVVGTATDNIPGGWDKSYTQFKNIQYSQDDITWTTAVNTDAFASNGIYTFAVDFSARYIRIATTGNNYVAISEFYALAPGQSYP